MTGGDDLEERVMLARFLDDPQFLGVVDERIGGAIFFSLRAFTAPPGKAEWHRAAATACVDEFVAERGRQSPRLA